MKLCVVGQGRSPLLNCGDFSSVNAVCADEQKHAGCGFCCLTCCTDWLGWWNKRSDNHFSVSRSGSNAYREGSSSAARTGGGRKRASSCKRAYHTFSPTARTPSSCSTTAGGAGARLVGSLSCAATLETESPVSLLSRRCPTCEVPVTFLILVSFLGRR